MTLPLSHRSPITIPESNLDITLPSPLPVGGEGVSRDEKAIRNWDDSPRRDHATTDRD